MKNAARGVPGLISLIMLIVTILTADGLLGALFSLSSVVLFILITGGGFRKALRPLKGLMPFFLFIFILNAVFDADGPTVWWHWGIFTLTLEGVLTGLRVIWRCSAVTAAAAAYMSAVSALEMTGSLSSLLKPLKFIGLPVERFSFIMSMSLFFVPELKDESSRLSRAVRARGASFGGDGLVARARSFLPLVIPLFLSAVRRADEMARALTARGYDGRVEEYGDKESGGSLSFFAMLLFIMFAIFTIWR